MGLLDTIRAGVKIADSVTQSLQASIKFERYLSSDGQGAKTYAAAVYLLGVAEKKQQMIRTQSGALVACRSNVLFLNVAALVIATSADGINNEDRITLPDGTTGPILEVGGFIDAGTGQPFATQVFLG